MAEDHSWDEIEKDLCQTAEFRDAYREADDAYRLGCRVRELRLAAGLTQKQLADCVGTSQSAIARLELGGASPRLDTLARLSEALGGRLVVRIEVGSAA
jgi:ribosome-binding protein aMBF1 (putative translation factor)